MSKHTPGPWTQATHSPTDVVSDGGTMVAAKECWHTHDVMEEFGA